MALSRLLGVKSRLHLQRVGLWKPTRRFYSTSTSSNAGTAEPSSSPPPPKKPSLAKERRAVAIELFVKKYMETHPGIFPKATHVQNEVGGSWSTLKSILTNLKEKMVGNPELQNHTTNDNSDSTVDATTSKVITTHNCSELGEAKSTVMNSEFIKDNISSTATSCVLGENSSKNMINAAASEIVPTFSGTDNTVLSEAESIVQSSRSLVDSENSENNTTNATAHISEECSSVDSVNLEAFEVIKMHSYPDSIKHAEPACTAQLPEAEVFSHGNEKVISTSAMSQIISENTSEDMVRSDNTSDSSKLLESKTEHKKPDREVSDIISSDGHQKSESCFHRLNGASRTMEGLDELASAGHRQHEHETEIMVSSLTTNAGSEMGGTPPVSFDGAQKITGLADLFMKLNDRAAGEMTGEKNDIVTPNCPENSNETTGRDKVKSYDIKGLIDCIMELPRDQSISRARNNIMSRKTDRCSNKGVIRGMQPKANSQRCDIKGRKTSLNGQSMGMESDNFKVSEGDPGTGALFKVFSTDSKSEDNEGSDAYIAAFDSLKSKPSPQDPFLTRKEDLKKSTDAFLAEKRSDENRVLLRFLRKSVEKSDINSIFKDCGCITKIEFHGKGCLYKTACIYFKTKEGMQIALKKNGLMVERDTLVVEPVCLTENMPNKTLIPNLIGDPDIPASLVKNPIRTVMIKQLTPDISPHDIEKALGFCGSNVTGFFFGSSSSVAYVEFETEEAKERALEKHSINVSGKQLLIFRVDAPRTTVVRISNQEANRKLYPIWNSYGKIKLIVVRSKEIVDVHFKLAEWPNMLKILNGLNGLQVDGRRCIAKPAPVFPPEVLHVLWSHPDERRRLKTKILVLLQKLEEYPPAQLTSMATKYYKRDYEHE